MALPFHCGVSPRFDTRQWSATFYIKRCSWSFVVGFARYDIAPGGLVSNDPECLFTMEKATRPVWKEQKTYSSYTLFSRNWRNNSRS